MAALHAGPLIITHVLTARIHTLKIALTVPRSPLANRRLVHRTVNTREDEEEKGTLFVNA